MRYAIFGAGSMANRRIKHLKELHFTEIICYDKREDRRKEVNEKYGIAIVCSVDEVVKFKPDAIFICVPPAHHSYYIDLALKHNWHFMTEQPIADRLDSLDAFVDNVKRHKLITHVSNNLIFNESIKTIKNIIEDNSIGPVLSGFVEVGEWLPDWHTYEPYQDYYPSRKEEGGGLDAICDISWLCKLFGKVSRVACFANKKTDLEINTDDVVQIMLDFKDGPQILLHTDMIQRPSTHKLKFICQNGIIKWDYSKSKVELYDAEKGKWLYYENKKPPITFDSMKGKEDWAWVEQMYFDDTKYFIDKLNFNDTDSTSLEDGIYYLKLILQSIKSNQENKIHIF